MQTFKRFFLFFFLNFLIILTISFILNFFHIGPYLNAYGINHKNLFLFCFIWGTGGALISLILSKQIAKWMMEISKIDPLDLQQRALLQYTEEIARKAGLNKTPELGIYHSKEVNAFATGPTKNHSLIALSTGLIENLQPHEIKAVIGHEISHISHGDMVTMTLLQGIVNAFVMFLSRILAYTLSGRSEKRNSNNSFYLLTFLFEILFMIPGSMLICFYSRKREFKADFKSACLTGKSNMIAALKALYSLKEIRDPSKEKTSLAAFKISSVKKRSLFSTHPSLEERIKRLESLKQ